MCFYISIDSYFTLILTTNHAIVLKIRCTYYRYASNRTLFYGENREEAKSVRILYQYAKSSEDKNFVF